MEIRNREIVEPFVALDNSIIREVLHPRNSKTRNQSLAEATVKPGKRTKEHYHGKSEEIYYILQGKGRIKVGGEEKDVKELDAILIPPNTRHFIKNIGDEDLVFLCCSAPAHSDDDTFII